MASTVSIPLWFFIVLLVISAYAVVVSLLFPGFRWFIRRRLNKAVDKLNASLQIQIKPFQRTKRQVLIEQLIFDQQVMATIETIALESNTPRDVLQQKVRHYASEIVPSFNAYVYFRIGYWAAKWLSRFIYRVKVAAADRDKLDAIDPDATIVFVMNHRSNMDYVLICYLAARQAILSYAVGEWARFFPLESLIRAMGAFFVRRGSQNPLYRKVLERYVYMATQSGVCQAVFLEGGLSRDGTLGEPRLGFLDYILRNYDYQKDRDVVFIPVGINYDRVLEDNNLLDWDDKSKRPGAVQHFKNFMGFARNNFLSGTKIRWLRHGYASVNFGIPLSMSDYCGERALGFDKLEKEARIVKIEELAKQLMTSIAHVIPVLPVPLLAAVFVRSNGARLKSVDVIAQCDDLIDQLIVHGAAMKVEQKPRHQTLAKALEQLRLRGVVREEDDNYTAVPKFRPLLHYYANSITHWLR